MKALVPLALAALLPACATSLTPQYDLRFGDAVREARQRQTLNPQAAANPDLAAGMDGRAAHEAQVRYQSSFRAPPPVVNVINIGGAAGGGAR